MGLSRINFGEWLPDQPGVSGALTEATNVYPVTNGYAPFPDLSNIGNPASESLTSSFTGKYGTAVTLFAGSASKLYKFNTTTLNYDNVSQSGGYSTSVIDFAQFGSAMIVANGSSKLQVWNLGSSTAFADLSAAAPIASYVTVVRDFVVAGVINGVSNKLQWSNINDETNWTAGVTSQSDVQVMADGGNIQGITGGEFGLILLEKSIYRMSYTGSPYFFQFDNIARGHGCFEPQSITQHRNITYYLSDDGFYQCNGQTVSAIGNEKVDRFFFKDIGSNNFNTISAATDPIKKLVIWNYKNTSGTYSQLIYHWELARWSYGKVQVSYISELSSPTIALESLNAYGSVDSITTSFDSRFWSGSKLLLSGINGKSVATIDGTNLTASITTGDMQMDGFRSVVTMARPIVDNGSATVAVASRNQLNDNIAYTTPSSANGDGRVPLRSAGRYHRYKVAPTGAWNYIVGIEIDEAPQGTR